MAECLANLRHKLHDSMGDAFERWGRLIARNPLKTIAVSAVLFFVLISGNMFAVQEPRANYLWPPTQSKAYAAWEYMKEHYGERSTMVVYAVRPNRGNIFDYDALDELMKMHEWTTTQCHAHKLDGSGWVRWKHVCHKYKYSDGECASPNFLAIWDYDREKLEARKKESQLLADVTWFHQHVSTIELFTGKPEFKGSGDDEEVEGAEGVVLTYELEGVDGDPYEFENAWLQGVREQVNPSKLTIATVSPRSYDDETSRTVTGDLPLFFLGLVIILVYLVLTLGPITSRVKSRVLLGMASMTNMLFALGGGFGLAAAAGVVLTPIAPLLPLIVLGVQVDGVIIMVDYLNAQDPADTVEARVGRSFRETGPAIFITTLTTVAAFGVGSNVDMPAVRAFCVYALCSFLVSALAMFTFFLALLVLDERRLQAGRVSFFPCVKVAGATVGEQPAVPPKPRAAAAEGAAAEGEADDKAAPAAGAIGPISRFVRDTYAPVLLKPAVSAVVVLVFVIVCALSAAAIPGLELGLGDADILPDDSYVQDVLRIQDDTFGGQRLRASVVVHNETFKQLEVRDRIDDALDEMQGRDFVTFGWDRWHVLYKKHLEANDRRDPSDDSYDKNKFTKGLGAWLDDNTMWLEDVVCDEPDKCEDPLSARYYMSYSKPLSGKAVDSLARRDYLESSLHRRGLLNAFVFHFTFLVQETDVIIWELVLTNLIGAIGAIFVIMLLFNPPAVAFWVVVCVTSINIDLFGMMWLTGVALNPVAFVNIVMSVGLSVDYCVHIAHTYDAAMTDLARSGSPIETRPRDAVVRALGMMGVSVLKGGWTTILGIFVIAFTSSSAFRIFFKMLVSVVVLGVLHGCVLLPVLLAWASRPCCGAGARAADEDKPAPAATHMQSVSPSP